MLVTNFNLFLDTALESKWSSPCLKKKYVAKLIKIKEHFDLCNISRLKNSDMKKFTFRQKHAFDFIQPKLVYFVISNSLQKVAEFFATLLTDCSAGLFQFQKTKIESMVTVSGNSTAFCF